MTERRRGRPPFPPNRELLEGESPCPICGRGHAQHRNGALGHPYPARVRWWRDLWRWLWTKGGDRV